MSHTIILILGLLLAPLGAYAQPLDTLRVAGTIARFDEARALDLDPQGRVYVVDGGASVVYQFSPTGLLLAQIGGPGSKEGAFFSPSDLDPTNGLVLVVADTGNSRLQRLSNRFVPLESIPVTRIDAFVPGQAGQPVYSLGSDGGVETADGTPIAVVTTSAGEMFAIDAAQGLVLKWDRQRRYERVVGSYAAGVGVLREPVALEADDVYLYVADAGQSAVLVYDHLGQYVRRIGAGRALDIVAVRSDGASLWVAGQDRIEVFQKPGYLLSRLFVEGLEEPLVDVFPMGDSVLLLTSRRLMHAPLP